MPQQLQIRHIALPMIRKGCEGGSAEGHEHLRILVATVDEDTHGSLTQTQLALLLEVEAIEVLKNALHHLRHHREVVPHFHEALHDVSLSRLAFDVGQHVLLDVLG